jgi:uncharacterized membrane protein
MKNLLWLLAAFLAAGIGLRTFYVVVFSGSRFGLLNTKPEALLNDPLWNTGFHIHILFGAVALLIGWLQFNARLRDKYLRLHRNIGKVYVISALLSAAAGMALGFVATGGPVAATGFIGLGIAWFSTTLAAYLVIRKKQILRHQKLMIYSYALCFAAVTLRLYLPLLTFLFDDFHTAYRIVAWLCWIPNLSAAWWLNIR